MKMEWVFLALMSLGGLTATGHESMKKETIPTTAGSVEITFLGHGSLMFTLNNTILHIDPYGKVADYGKLPQADLILLTHAHADHLDPVALQAVRTDKTAVVGPQACAHRVAGMTVMGNGDRKRILEVEIEAVPAYNLVHKRDNGEPFHPPGVGNGYVLNFGQTRIYVAGDTENIPEMKALRAIDIAFLPMKLPYTMTPQMAADAAKAFTPKILYPYHYGDTEPARLVALLKQRPEIEVRIRPMR